MSGLKLLRLQVSVDARSNGDEQRHDAARERRADDKHNHGDDAFHLLPDQKISDASEQKKVQHEDQNRIFRWLLRINEIATAARWRRRWSGRRWRRSERTAGCVHYIFSAKSVMTGKRMRSPLSAFMMAMMMTTRKPRAMTQCTRAMPQPMMAGMKCSTMATTIHSNTHAIVNARPFLACHCTSRSSFFTRSGMRARMPRYESTSIKLRSELGAAPPPGGGGGGGGGVYVPPPGGGVGGTEGGGISLISSPSLRNLGIDCMRSFIASRLRMTLRVTFLDEQAAVQRPEEETPSTRATA